MICALRRPGEPSLVATTNDLGVRVEPGARVIRPPRLTVHLGPLDPNEQCWRCDVAEDAAA